MSLSETANSAFSCFKTEAIACACPVIVIMMVTINYMIYPITIVRYFQETMYVDVDSLRCVQISARAAWTEHGQSLQVI